MTSEPLAAFVPAMTDPAAVLSEIESLGQVERTPCGSGSMLWRVWGQGEPLVLLHGGFGSWNHWVRNVEPLARHYRVLAADMPGQGDSDDPPQPYDPESLAAIVGAGVAALTDPGERIRLAGFSFGSVIGGLVARDLGDRLLSFTGVGAAGLGERRRMVEQMTRVTPDMTDAVRAAALRRNLRLLMFADDANIDPLAEHIQSVNNARNRIRSRPISLTDLLMRTFPTIRGRINLIWGSEDITAVGHFDARHAQLRSIQPDAGIVMLDGVGHWVQYEAADRFNEVLLGALEADPAG